MEGLQGGGRHGHQRRGPELQGEHAGAEIEGRRGGPGRSEQGERLSTVGLGHPERPVAKLFRRPGDLDAAGHSEGSEARVGHAERGVGCHPRDAIGPKCAGPVTEISEPLKPSRHTRPVRCQYGSGMPSRTGRLGGFDDADPRQ